MRNILHAPIRAMKSKPFSPTDPMVVLGKIDKAKNKKDRLEIIQKFKSQPLFLLLRLAYDNTLDFDPDVVPMKGWSCETADAGMGYVSLGHALKRIYIFRKSFRGNLTLETKCKKLTILLESLSQQEANMLWAAMSSTRLPVKGMTRKFVQDAFPELLPEVTK